MVFIIGIIGTIIAAVVDVGFEVKDVKFFFGLGLITGILAVTFGGAQ